MDETLEDERTMTDAMAWIYASVYDAHMSNVSTYPSHNDACNRAWDAAEHFRTHREKQIEEE